MMSHTLDFSIVLNIFVISGVSNFLMIVYLHCVLS